MKSTTSLFHAVVGPVQYRLAPPTASAHTARYEAALVQRTTAPAPSLARRFAGLVGNLAEQFWAAFENGERHRRERWLAQSTDIYDLERRMQDLERRSTRSAI